MATKKAPDAPEASERERELESRVRVLEGRMHVQGVREPRLERRSGELATEEAHRLLDRYGHQHQLVGAIEPSEELVALCALGANQQASARARLEVALHRRKGNGKS